MQPSEMSSKGVFVGGVPMDVLARKGDTEWLGHKRRGCRSKRRVAGNEPEIGREEEQRRAGHGRKGGRKVDGRKASRWRRAHHQDASLRSRIGRVGAINVVHGQGRRRFGDAISAWAPPVADPKWGEGRGGGGGRGKRGGREREKRGKRVREDEKNEGETES